MNIVEDIKKLLIDNGVFSDDSVVKLADLPDKPDTCFALYEYGGQTPLERTKIKRPALQVRGRSKSYSELRSKIYEIEALLSRIGDEDDEQYAEGVTINNNHYFKIDVATGVLPLGKDSQRRHEVTQNYYINVKGN